MQHTIELMKNKNQLQQKIVEFIKNADLYMDNFEYVDMDKIQLKTGEGDEKPDEKVLDIPENIICLLYTSCFDKRGYSTSVSEAREESVL